MKSLWHINPRYSEIRNAELESTKDKVIINSSFSLISIGTEALIAKGGVDAALESYMKVPYMEGGFDLPIKYGYSLVGRTENGELIHVMHPHQDRCILSPESIYFLPKDLPPDRACLLSNMETVINAIWDSQPSASDKIAVCGFGGIGALLANTLRVHFDIEVDIIEVDKWRCKKAVTMNWQLSKKDTTYDIIYHTTASANGLQRSIDSLQDEGMVVELSWYGDKAVNLKLGHNFHYKRLTIRSSQVSVIPKAMRRHHTYKSRKDLAAEYLTDHSYDQLITGTIPFADTPEFFNKLRRGKQGDGLIWLIQY